MTWPTLSKLRSLLRPGLSARIAMTIIAALVALQLLALGLFFLGAREPGPITIYGARWLTEAAESAANPASQRPAKTETRRSRRFLTRSGFRSTGAKMSRSRVPMGLVRT